MSFAYLRLFIFLLQSYSSLWFIQPSISHVYSRVRHDWVTNTHTHTHTHAHTVYKLYKQGDNIQPYCTPFSILNQSVVLRLVLTVVSWPTHRFLRRQVRWSGTPIYLGIFPVYYDPHKSFSIINEAEVDAFLEFPCFLQDPMNIGNLIPLSLLLQNQLGSSWFT